MIPPVLVIDANIVVSALLKNSFTTRLLLFHPDTKLVAPELLRDEIVRHAIELSNRLRVSEFQLIELLDDLLKEADIELTSSEQFTEFLPMAAETSPDLEDAAYIALALKLDCPLWSNDKALQQQNGVKVYSTHELVKEWNQ